MNECMKETWKGKCCCTCKFHFQDFHHCTTVSRVQVDGCICSEQKGWICAGEAVENGHYHSGWSEHGLCEMWEKANES